MNIKLVNRAKIGQKKPEDFMSKVVDIIFLVCKNDTHFEDYKKMDELVKKDKEISKDKIEKQNELLKQSSEMINDLKEKNRMLSDDNFNKRAKILEMLGSEI